MDKLSLIIIVAVILSAPAHAASVYVGAWSKHMDSGKYNETHDLVALEHRGWIAGTLVNSYNDRTYIAGYGWDLVQVTDWKIRLHAGASYGYRTCKTGQTGEKARVCPLLVPELTYTKYRIQPAILLFGGSAALSLKLEF